jgi:hypothetical protein
MTNKSINNQTQSLSAQNIYKKYQSFLNSLTLKKIRHNKNIEANEFKHLNYRSVVDAMKIYQRSFKRQSNFQFEQILFTTHRYNIIRQITDDFGYYFDKKQNYQRIIKFQNETEPEELQAEIVDEVERNQQIKLVQKFLQNEPALTRKIINAKLAGKDFH